MVGERGQKDIREGRIRIYRKTPVEKKGETGCDRTNSGFFPEILIENSGMADCRGVYFFELWSGLSLI